MVWLGVDGGMSKTEALLVSESGVLGFARGGPSNHQGVGLGAAVDAVTEVVEKALEDAKVSLSQVSRAVLGLAGADFPEDVEQLVRGLASYFGAVPYAVVNDAEIALAAGTEASYGIVVIAGTGTNVFGRNPQGLARHVGGLGYEYGDYGSGVDMARDVLHAAFRSAELRGPKTALEALVLQSLGQPDYTALARAMYFRQIPEMMLIVLAPLCFQAARAEDAVAIQILQRQGAALAESVLGCARLLDMVTLEADVVLAGSLWLGQAPHMRDSFDGVLAETWPQARVRVAELKPVVGAALLAVPDAGTRASVRRTCRQDPRLKGIE
ncbi:MAG: hypothetical protein OWU84_04865 [Firmicutes bacterium]|nr:hypothetical protein [Bacillota bacterium]